MLSFFCSFGRTACYGGLLLCASYSFIASLSCDWIWWKEGGGLQFGPVHPILRTTKTSAFPINAKSRFSSAVLKGVLGPSRIAEQQHYVVPETTQGTRQVHGLWWVLFLMKKTFCGPRLQGSYWKEEKSVSLTRGLWFALQANQWVFTYLAPIIFECLRPPWLNPIICFDRILDARPFWVLVEPPPRPTTGYWTAAATPWT